MKTQEILDLALRKGEVTSSDVVRELTGESKSAREYRNLLAQASTLLFRLYKKGVLARNWSRSNRGQYVYSPSEKTIDSLLPVLGLLEERKRRREIEKALTDFTKRIILKLRMENDVRAILYDPFSGQAGTPEPMPRVWIVTNDSKRRHSIVEEARAVDEGFKVTFLLPHQLSSSRIINLAKILYGWDYITSIRRKGSDSLLRERSE